MKEWSYEVVVAVSEPGAPLPELDTCVGEKTGEEIGEMSKDETALFLLLTRERAGEEMGDTSWSDV